MRLEIYAEETRRLASELGGVLAEVRQLLQAQHPLSKLEQSGALHAIQVLTENSIGKAKVILKSQGHTVPVSAYDAFSKLHALGYINADQLRDWTAAIGMRNRIVHEYLNVSMTVVEEIIVKQQYQLQIDFLMAEMPAPK
jgi:uncharacterized protein YutE (UPF0331/DUF86 family)